MAWRWRKSGAKSAENQLPLPSFSATSSLSSFSLFFLSPPWPSATTTLTTGLNTIISHNPNPHQWQNSWYDPGKVKFRFWHKMCNYLVLRQQSEFSIRPLDRDNILCGLSRHVVLPCFKISGQSEFGKASKHRSTEAVWILLFTSFWLVDFLFG